VHRTRSAAGPDRPSALYGPLQELRPTETAVDASRERCTGPGANAVRYAFDGERSREVRVHVSVDATGISLTVEDDGRHFNPLQEAPVPDTETPLEDRPVGGLGLLLVKEMVSRLDYEREGDTNRVHMRVDRTA